MLTEIKPRVVPATREALWKFPKKDLDAYAKTLGIEPGRTKAYTIDVLVWSKKATLCATLGD